MDCCGLCGEIYSADDGCRLSEVEKTISSSSLIYVVFCTHCYNGFDVYCCLVYSSTIASCMVRLENVSSLVKILYMCRRACWSIFSGTVRLENVSSLVEILFMCV